MNEESLSFLEESPLLDFSHPALAELIRKRAWPDLPSFERIGAIYKFVRDEIHFGYNESDDLQASRILSDGYGQCNTKSTLLMALLRGSGIPCRLHGATIHKRLQKGVVRGFFYWVAPRDIFHTWVEVQSSGKWVGLEGVILDRAYIHGVRHQVEVRFGTMLGFGVGTNVWENPLIDWKGESTEIQQSGVNANFGVFASPDEFYAKFGANLRGARGWIFRHLVRHLMNRRARKIRETICSEMIGRGCASIPSADTTERSKRGAH